MSNAATEGWTLTPLSNLGVFSKGRGISKSETVAAGIPCVRYAEIYTDYDFYIRSFKSFISPASAESSKKLSQNDIIFAGSGETVEDIGKSVAFTLDCEAYVGGDSIVLSPRSDVDSTFLSYQLNDDIRRKQLRKLGQGSSVIHIYSSGLQEVVVNLPPLPEQKKIASILTSVDEVIENTQKQIDKLQDLKKATMNELLTKGIGHTEFKDSELGRIPKSWEVRAISEVVSIPNGQVDPKLEPYASMPHIGSGNIISWTGQVKGVQTAFEAGQISGKYLFSKNHILYSKVRPNLAKVCMPQFDGICSADVYPLIPKQKVSGKFVFQYLLTEKFTQIATEVSERTGMPKINRQDLNVLKLPMPPFEEQSEIARKIEAIDKATSLKSIKLSQTQSLKKSLMQDLLTGKVRVSVN